MDALLNADWELLSAAIVGGVIFLLLLVGIAIGLSSDKPRPTAVDESGSPLDVNVFYPLPEDNTAEAKAKARNNIGSKGFGGYSNPLSFDNQFSVTTLEHGMFND